MVHEMGTRTCPVSSGRRREEMSYSTGLIRTIPSSGLARLRGSVPRHDGSHDVPVDTLLRESSLPLFSFGLRLYALLPNIRNRNTSGLCPYHISYGVLLDFCVAVGLLLTMYTAVKTASFHMFWPRWESAIIALALSRMVLLNRSLVPFC